MSGEVFRLPERSVLLHVGPHKTGTSAVQAAFRAARDHLETAGVVYIAGNDRRMGARAVSGSAPQIGQPEPSLASWQRVVDQVHAAADGLVVLSSEAFSEADDSAIARILDDLDRDRVHVVVTLRPLRKILPSQWQQHIQAGYRRGYDEWLRRVFDPQPTGIAALFWMRHDHGALVERWAAAVGPDAMTVIVLDDADPGMLLRAFGDLAGLPIGVLAPVSSAVNRSLSAAEVDLLRRVNVEFHRREWLSRYMPLVHDGAARGIKSGREIPSDEPRLRTPAWALETATSRGMQAAQRIRATKVHVVGDLAGLHSPPAEAEIGRDFEPASPLDPDIAVQAIIGTVDAIGEPTKRKPSRSRSIDQASSRALLRALARRARKRILPRRKRS